MRKGLNPSQSQGPRFSSPCISSLCLCQDGLWGENLEVAFHEIDAVVSLPRMNTEQKEMGGKEAVSMAFWPALVYTAVLGGFS